MMMKLMTSAALNVHHCVKPYLTERWFQCSRTRILRFCQIQKHDFLRFLNDIYQKVVKSL